MLTPGRGWRRSSSINWARPASTGNRPDRGWGATLSKGFHSSCKRGERRSSRSRHPGVFPDACRCLTREWRRSGKAAKPKFSLPLVNNLFASPRHRSAPPVTGLCLEITAKGSFGDKDMSRPYCAVLVLQVSVLLSGTLLYSPGAFGQATPPVPANAVASRYGSGWECDRGFRRQGDSCVAVMAPDHAFLTNESFGKGWECHYGFAENGNGCLAVQVPANAYLDPYYGDRWQCMRGHRRNDTGCELIDLPDNAFLTDSTFNEGWECERGYQNVGRKCAALIVPEHAYLTTSGNEWICDRGFEKKDKACVAVQVPKNAFFVDTSYGQKWKCDRGYEAKGMKCSEIKLPQNAHLDSSGNAWECNRPYRLRSGVCSME
ncbi:hypothetical protein SJ05684_c03470 [Sinorhizobium sojae CCBAU 05684]|uniref:MSP1 EGF domain 1 n=2 Tax=Sinorhizobium sojae TaxID=716925 RepID=A0A249P819_9HYPH|nr:hypothetical protein SJ05684_c03470 [Sinorhizobium sojae CCBAU 05684]